MRLWLDAQLPPAIARWLTDELGLAAIAVRDLGLRDADDRVIFDAARTDGSILISKDQEFVALVQRLGPPPKLVWLTCGNTSNEALRALFRSALSDALWQLDEGDAIANSDDFAHAPRSGIRRRQRRKRKSRRARSCVIPRAPRAVSIPPAVTASTAASWRTRPA